jgi:AhpD family alkylhydroperoxidase
MFSTFSWAVLLVSMNCNPCIKVHSNHGHNLGVQEVTRNNLKVV